MEMTPEAARILIVDDEPEMVDLIKDILAEEPYRTESAASGPEALARVRRDPPDLILLDVAMPDMNGFEVCRHLKADPGTATVPVLFVTALDAMRDKEMGLASGADDYVTKPVDPADLRNRVRALLRVRHLSKELDRTLAYLQELDAARQTAAFAAAVWGAGAGGRGSVQPPADKDAPHVLLVDDDRLVWELYGRLLEDTGYRVTAVESAREAYEAAARGVDVILLDIMMTEVSGLEALGRLRQIAPEAPVIILTAYETTQNAIGALRGGAFDFIVKGLKREMVPNAVARAVERRRLTLENRRLMEALRARLDAALAPPGSEPDPRPGP